MPIEPAESLFKSRSYIGLVLAQFLAAFNDQAIHFVAIFYAGDMLVRYIGAKHFDEKLIVTIVTACFISPFFFFSPLAGILADKYSKRNTLVFWKYAEVGITTLALCGFLLPHTAAWGWAEPKTLAACGAGLVIAAVFMMGTHSAFFVPAKYGIMPEILHTSVLSRGNGLLEGTSFTANILGTAFGGFCYDRWKSTGFDTGQLQPGHEWIIGLVLLGLAIIGTVAAQLIAKVPAAAPDRPFIWQPWIPLKANWEVLRKSRPLVLATVGIAFFTFMTLFLRQTLIFQGEAAKEYHAAKYSNHKLVHAHEPADLDLTDPAAVMPEATSAQQAELRVAMLVALVGLGVGIGCALAGQLSGDRIELGLVPLGAVLMTFLMAMLAWVISTHRIHSDWPTGICLIFVGIAAGLYIVPMYTLLQHRAPKDSKGGLVAMSNFLNVSGGLIAIAVFYFLTGTMQSVLGLNLRAHDVRADPTLWTEYLRQLEQQLQIPRYLFLSGSVITLLMLIFFIRARPDFLLRTLSYFRVPGRRRLHAIGLTNVPANGQLILATNCQGADQWMQVLSALDRGTRYVKTTGPTVVVAQNEPVGATSADRSHHPYSSPVIEEQSDDSFLDAVARRAGVMIAAPTDADGPRFARIVDAGHIAQAGNLLGLAIDAPLESEQAEQLLEQLQARVPSCVLPVHCGAAPTVGLHLTSWRPVVSVGKPLPPSATPAEIRAAIEALGEGAHHESASTTSVH